MGRYVRAVPARVRCAETTHQRLCARLCATSLCMLHELPRTNVYVQAAGAYRHAQQQEAVFVRVLQVNVSVKFMSSTQLTRWQRAVEAMQGKLCRQGAVSLCVCARCAHFCSCRESPASFPK